MSKLAKVGSIVEPFTERMFDGVHPPVRTAVSPLEAFSAGVVHEHDDPMRRVNIQPCFKIFELGWSDAQIAFNKQVTIGRPLVHDVVNTSEFGGCG